MSADALAEYRALAAARHALAMELSTPAASSSLADVSSPPFSRHASQQRSDLIVCNCTSARARCSLCMAHDLAGSTLGNALGSGAVQFVYMPHLPVVGDSGSAVAPAAHASSPLAAAAGLYHDVFPNGESDSALRLSHELSTADKLALSAQGIDDQRALIYGEIRFFAFARCLELGLSLLTAERRSRPVFYDLGSGIGKPVVAAALLFPFRRAVGVELLPSLHALATSAAARLVNTNHSSPPSIEFVCGDLFQQDVTDADLVFVASTGFDARMFARLAAHLATMRAGSVVLTLSLPLPGTDFEVALEQRYRFSWGNCSVFFARRR